MQGGKKTRKEEYLDSCQSLLAFGGQLVGCIFVEVFFFKSYINGAETKQRKSKDKILLVDKHCSSSMIRIVPGHDSMVCNVW